MTLVAERLDFRAASERVAKEWKDSPRQAELRRQGAELASRIEWPDSRASRPWKYYDASAIGLTPDSPLAEVHVEISGAPAGTAVRFSDAGGPAAEVIAKNLGTVVPPDKDRLTALHYAYLRDGVLVNIGANVELDAPIRLRREMSGTGVSTPHTLIVTGANSRVTVVQEYVSGAEPVIGLPIAEIIPGPGSEVAYYCVWRLGSKTKVFANQRFWGRERDAAFRNLHIVLSGEVVKGHLESSLEGRGTSSELLGVAYGAGSAHADFFTLQDHIGPDTRSDLKYKAALRDESRAVYYGLTRVGLGAKNADANQENRNLLLSKTARADSDPVLEILTSDIVRAAHGATAGPVDQEQLFYMQARGIPHPEAEAMLVHAFLEDVLSRVPNEALRAEFIEILAEAMD